jgi:hypothetical protein
MQIAKICSGYKCKEDVQVSIKPKRHTKIWGLMQFLSVPSSWIPESGIHKHQFYATILSLTRRCLTKRFKEFLTNGMEYDVSLVCPNGFAPLSLRLQELHKKNWWKGKSLNWLEWLVDPSWSKTLLLLVFFQKKVSLGHS